MDFKVIANWKMNPKTQKEALKLAKAVKDKIIPIVGYEAAFCPPAIYLPVISKQLELTSIKLGAQNISHQAVGELTGEISAPMVNTYADYVILGHSERRDKFDEGDELVNKKVQIALEYDLKPIVCVGETLEDYRSGKQDLIVDHMKASIKNVSRKQIKNVIVAYEPIWAIGTKNPADADYANQIISLLRQGLAAMYNREIAYEVPLIYGGSVDSNNIESFASQPEINGALIGSASLDFNEFSKICQLIKESPDGSKIIDK